MTRDVTDCWDAERIVGGVYIVRSTVDGRRDRVRIGAGGIKGGRKGIYRRLSNHRKRRPAAPKYETHLCQPFAVVHAWGLAGWTPGQIEDAEHCLYRAFLRRFPKHRGDLPDKSLFIVPEGQDWADIIAEVGADLGIMEGL